MIKHLELKAYGKINLGLDVLHKREDGYHDVCMVMQTVGIYDRVDIQWKKTPGIALETNLFYLPNNENNLVYRAVKLLMDEFKIREGVQIYLNKFIPVAAGMAGGSADAAAAMFGINKMFQLGLSRAELMKRGVAIGADVPYCLMRGTVLCQGIGEILTPLPPMQQCHVLLVKPGISVSTGFVYENLRLDQLTREDHPDISSIVSGVKEQDFRKVACNLGNILELVTIPKYPIIAEIKEVLLQAGAVNALMSGSGPTVFGLFTDLQEAKSVYEQLRFGKHSQLAKQVYLTDFYNTKEIHHGK